MLISLYARYHRRIITTRHGRGKEILCPTSRNNFDLSMSTTKSSSCNPTLIPWGFKACFYPEVIEPATHPVRMSREIKIHSGTWNIVGGVASKDLTGLYSECKCCKTNKCICLYKYSASSQVIEPLVNIESRGVPVAWSAGLSVERGVQRWGPMRIQGEMACVWSPIRCQRCFGCLKHRRGCRSCLCQARLFKEPRQFCSSSFKWESFFQLIASAST